MSDPTGPDSPKPRGESAWKAHRDAVEARNAEAKRAGKVRHDDWERVRATSRRLREEERQTAVGETRKAADSASADPAP